MEMAAQNPEGKKRASCSPSSFYTAAAPEMWISGGEKTLLSWLQGTLTGNQATVDGIRYSRKGIYNSQNHVRL